MKVILCDEPKVRENLLPLTFTRPVALLRVGITTLEEKWMDFLGEAFDGLASGGYSTEDYLQKKFPCRPQKDDVNLMVNASFVPDADLVQAIKKLKKNEVLFAAETQDPERDTRWVAYYVSDSRIDRKPVVYKGESLQIVHVWDIFTHNGAQIEKDLERCEGRARRGCVGQNALSDSVHFGNTPKPITGPSGLGEGLRIIGDPAQVYAEEGARVDYALLDTTEGPIYLGKNSRIMPNGYIKGPLALCEGSLIKVGAKIYGGCTFGPYCKVAGEVESTVMTGYSNKAHDGFLGDAVLGEWCNLGAGTNNSNLKNDYSEVRVWNYATEHFDKTGLQFCGLFMGDHSKSAIGTQFNTGTVVGVASNVFAEGFPKNFVPSFTWGKETYRVERAIETAKIVCARRNKKFDAKDEAILRSIYEQTVESRSRSQKEDRPLYRIRKFLKK